MKKLILVLTALIVSGCNTLSSMTPDFTPTDHSYYTLDTKQRVLCRGSSTTCVDINTIISSLHELRYVEKAFNQQVPGPNQIVSLMKLLLRPNDKSHTVTAVSGQRYRYTIPATDNMEVVWRILKRSHASHYEKAN